MTACLWAMPRARWATVIVTTPGVPATITEVALYDTTEEERQHHRLDRHAVQPGQPRQPEQRRQGRDGPGSQPAEGGPGRLPDGRQDLARGRTRDLRVRPDQPGPLRRQPGPAAGRL